MATLRELANLYAKKQPKMVDNLTDQAPILEGINFEEASHGMWNVYEEIQSITGAGFVNMNAALPTMSVSTDLKKVDLNIMGGEMEVPEDTAKMFGSAEAYFAKKQGPLLAQIGQDTEYAMLYNNLLAYAYDADEWLNAGGDGNGYSILAVRWIPGEVCGLFSPEGFKKGAMLDVSWYNGGALYKNSSGVPVKGLRYKGYFGLQIGSTRAVNAIFNIETGHVPTKTQVEDLLASVRATPGNTKLYMHTKCKNLAINPLKAADVTMAHLSGEVNTLVESFNKIQIVESYNFLDGTEARRT